MNNSVKDIAIKMQRIEKTYVIFCSGTKMPFITCDEETFNDQIWIFTSEEKGKEFAEFRKDQYQDNLMVVVMENNQLLEFYSSLYSMGINELVYADGEESTKVPLDQLVKEPDFSKLPVEKRPVFNPQMQLTGLTFMQEIHRLKPNNEKPKLRELEEEMAANLVKTRFLMAIEVEGAKLDTKKGNFKIPCVKNQEGKMYQPLFTDAYEFKKFNVNNKFQATLVDFKNIQKVLGNNVEGIAINPQSMNIVIVADKIPMLLQRFPVE